MQGPSESDSLAKLQKGGNCLGLGSFYKYLEERFMLERSLNNYHSAHTTKKLLVSDLSHAFCLVRPGPLLNNFVVAREYN